MIAMRDANTGMRKLAVILGMALVVKIMVMLIMKSYLHTATLEYEIIANSILSGKGFVYDFLGTTYRSLNTPLYSYLCVAIYALTNHSHFAVLLVHSLFTIFLAFVVFDIARYLFDEMSGLLAAGVVAFHPAFMYYDAFTLAPMSIDSFLIALTALLTLKFKDRPTVLKMSFIGVTIGLGTLSRGIIGALLPFVALYLILFMKNVKKKEKIGLITALFLATVLVISPWIIRNYSIHKTFVLISSTAGENFYRGNNPTATGISLTPKGESVRELWPKEVTEKIATLDEIGQMRFFQKEAMNFIINNPRTFAKLYLKKLYYFWWFSPQSGLLYPKAYFKIYRFFYSAVLIFSILGLALALIFKKSARDGVPLLIMIVFSICIAQSFFYVEGRHRCLIEPLLLIFASYGVVMLWRFLTKKAII